MMTKQEEIEELESYKQFMADMQAENEIIYKCPHDPNENHFKGQIDYCEARLQKLRDEKDI